MLGSVDRCWLRSATSPWVRPAPRALGVEPEVWLVDSTMHALAALLPGFRFFTNFAFQLWYLLAYNHLRRVFAAGETWGGCFRVEMGPGRKSSKTGSQMCLCFNVAFVHALASRQVAWTQEVLKYSLDFWGNNRLHGFLAIYMVSMFFHVFSRSRLASCLFMVWNKDSHHFLCRLFPGWAVVKPSGTPPLGGCNSSTEERKFVQKETVLPAM